jgi:ATP-dependent helicase/nuclease subunit A
MLTDQAQRQRAIDPQQSFIVQAPAGSGKTELLVQRFLVLLAQVKQPEEIIAITFTRKAAAEMRERVINALELVKPAVYQPVEGVTQQLAQKVLQHDVEKEWQLLNNPNRLRIYTIDALCASLTRQMPVLSHFGAQPEISNDANACYLQAARQLLATLESKQPWVPALQKLLLHIDNNYFVAENLLVTMLAQRDQWLPHILEAKNNINELRKILEQGLLNVVLENLTSCYGNFPTQHLSELLELIQFALHHLKEPNPALQTWDNLTDKLQPTLSNRASWEALGNFLLTQKYQWRKVVDVRNGFPSTTQNDKIIKQRMHSLLEQFEINEAFRQSLQDLLESPPVVYSDQQWLIIDVLVELLPILAAQLTLVFRDQGQVDFTEIATAAINALGAHEDPSELALRLDYQIQHLLIDEFQDTSLTQFRLLELLTAGWQNNDGHTLFLVGDPMQSIYRFRQAEVGLFLRAQHEGVGQIKLEPLHLTTNFRSNSQLVNWFNQTFTQIFPAVENIATGAVKFNPCVAMLNLDSPALYIHPAIAATEDNQAQKIVEIILHNQQQNPQEKIAILVRSRSHLFPIIQALQLAGLPFRGVEIEKLADYSIAQDLFALTRALLHLADRIAWLAILRAPWCGLNLSDLHSLAAQHCEKTLYELLLSYDAHAELSNDAKQRLSRVTPILHNAITNRQRQSLREWVEHTWLALGGPACVEAEIDLKHAQTYFELLEQVPIASHTNPLLWLKEKLESTYTNPERSENDNLQIMTIHKAKGLEFDTVILPYLERKLASDENKLLLWMQRPRLHGGSDLILAPIKANTIDEDPIYTYLRSQESQKNDYETMRLLYVAATRAKKSLHLLGTVKRDSKKLTELTKPSANSFLGLLWPTVKNYFTEALANTSHDELIQTPTNNETSQTLRRLSANWQHPLPDKIKLTITNTNDKLTQIELTQFWLEQTAKAVGTLTHQYLQRMALDGIDTWPLEKIKQQQPIWHKELLQLGIISSDINQSIQTITTGLVNTLQDERGRWILSNHTEARSEFPITYTDSNSISHFIIDRTFVTDDGTRWIIDYKTTGFVGEDSEQFLQQQKEAHRSQLESYARAMQALTPQLIRLGLYFPLFSGWIDWEFSAIHSHSCIG